MNLKSAEIVDKCLFEYQDICDELGIKSCIMYGTCLGFYRDGTYCKGDFDLDVGALCSKEKLVELFAKLREKGFVQKEFWQNQGWEYNQHFWKYEVLLDVHVQLLKDEDKFFEDTETLKYKDREFNIAHPIKEYLTLEYGEDWKTTKPGIVYVDGIEIDNRSRPLKGERKRFNGGPEESKPIILSKLLDCKEKRYEGE